MALTELESLGIAPASEEEKLFHRHVDQSSFAAEEWVEALREFSEWLGRRSRPYEVKEALEYLHCCALSTETQIIKVPLWKVVAQMLDDYGYEGRKQSC